jgi:solute carrier family 13 (sodium-dependent dicarboxylate transporter), member 2/3/5
MKRPSSQDASPPAGAQPHPMQSTPASPFGSPRPSFFERVRPTTLLSLFAVLSVALVLVLLAWTDLPREAAFMSGIFLLAALLWSTEALPQATTALLALGLMILLLANPGGWHGLGFEERPSPAYGEVIRAAVDPVILLFFGGLLLAQAAVVTGVDRTLAQLILRPFGHGPAMLLLGTMLVTAFFSMWMSNTAATAMMIMIVAPLLRDLKTNRFSIAVGLAIPFAANIGGIGTPIGSPPNAVAVGYLQRADLPIPFLQWMILAVPLMLLLLLITWLILIGFYRSGIRRIELKSAAEPMTRRKWAVVLIFIITVLLWVSEAWHGLPSAAVALLPVVVLMSLGIIKREHVNSIDLDILILIGGGIALGAGVRMTGLDEVLIGLLPQEGWLVGRGFLTLAVVVTILLSTFMSNTAAANVLLPLGISFGISLGDEAEAIVIAISIGLAASMAMALPVSNAPNAMAYARANIPIRSMALIGGLIGLVGAVLVALFGPPIIRFWHG